MFRLSKKMLFAIEAVVDIAYHAGSQPVQSRDITRRQDIPRRYLEQALQQLVKANLLTGVRGPRGGYNLARERRRISVGDIVEVMRNLEQSVDVLEGDIDSELRQIVINSVWEEIQNNMMARLNDISIDYLCQQAHGKGVVSEGQQNLDFSI